MHFCLSEGAHRRERKRVVVDVGLPVLEVLERFGCPLRGRKVEVLVLGRRERRRVTRNHLNIDCHHILSDHLSDTAQIARRHDGRHLGMLSQALALRTENFTNNFVRLLTTASQSKDESLLIVFYCKHGRHRSVSVAMLYTIVLTILGADVTIILPQNKRCSCVECDKYSKLKLLAGELNDWIDSISDNLCSYLRTHIIATPHERQMLEDVVEFMDYCPIGYDSGV